MTSPDDIQVPKTHPRPHTGEIDNIVLQLVQARLDYVPDLPHDLHGCCQVLKQSPDKNHLLRLMSLEMRCKHCPS